jgi:aspartate/methionine/tyrosine aminotransferase
MKQPMAARLAGFGTTVFSEFSALAAKHGAVNLGQGFPDFDGPAEIKLAAIRLAPRSCVGRLPRTPRGSTGWSWTRRR